MKIYNVSNNVIITPEIENFYLNLEHPLIRSEYYIMRCVCSNNLYFCEWNEWLMNIIKSLIFDLNKFFIQKGFLCFIIIKKKKDLKHIEKVVSTLWKYINYDFVLRHTCDVHQRRKGVEYTFTTELAQYEWYEAMLPEISNSNSRCVFVCLQI